MVFFLRNSSTIIIIMLLSSISNPLFPAHPYHTDDPGVTEKNKYELEMAVDYWQNSATPGFVFKHGLTDKMELDIPIYYTALPKEERGIAPLQLYAKFSFIPEVVAATITCIPGDKTFMINGIVSKSFGLFRFIGNLGGSMVGNSNDADLIFCSSSTFTFGKFEAGSEISGTQEGLNWWQIGSRFYFTDWFSLDAGFGGDFAKPGDNTITTGLWFTFPISKENKNGD